VVDHACYTWQDSGWSGLPLRDYIIYELHVGTFTSAGTFDAIIPRLADLKDLGITAIEIMPVAQFPGARNWGYDGVYPFAVQNSYGGPAGLKRLVDACHQQNIAVIMDVVYNHFGPEGNYTGCFGPYVTDQYKTPWGSAINFDGPDSGGVRHFFIQNALSWFEDYHIDALRLDAIHAIYDCGAKHFLTELAEAVGSMSGKLNRPCYLIAESDLNDVRVIRSQAQGGYGIDAQWSDDFHHALHVALTGESNGYYEDFTDLRDLATAYAQRFVYNWKYSKHRRRYHGSDASDRLAAQFVVCSQNHDQTGNRMLGERLSQLVPFEALKLAAGTVLLSPYIPLLFMGEEYGEIAPFQYFVSHGDSDLIEAVRQGRKAEFTAFHAQGEPPDAASIETFKRSQLNWSLRTDQSAAAPHPHQTLLQFYQQVIQLRKHLGIAAASGSQSSDVNSRQPSAVVFDEKQQVLQVQLETRSGNLLSLMNFSDRPAQVQIALGQYPWQNRLDSAISTWAGPGSTAPPNLIDDATVTLAAYQYLLYQVVDTAT
jgi:maltooligosyltrehalose trehalohydrolase